MAICLHSLYFNKSKHKPGRCFASSLIRAHFSKIVLLYIYSFIIYIVLYIYHMNIISPFVYLNSYMCLIIFG